MARTYSYDPGKLNENGMDRMRMELGDTTFAPGELTAALCDEEYIAILNQNKSWKKAKLKCLQAIVMRFAHQVNMSVDGLCWLYSAVYNATYMLPEAILTTVLVVILIRVAPQIFDPQNARA